MDRPALLAGAPQPAAPLGATLTPDGVRFSVYSKRATAMDLLLFDHVDDRKPARRIALDPRMDRTGDYWHTHVDGLVAGQLYGYAADGPWAPERSRRFDATKTLLDPYGRGVAVSEAYRPVLAGGEASDAVPMKSQVIDTTAYDWEGDRPLHRPFRDTIIYEVHLGAFTADPSSGVSEPERGTYLGFIEKIPYLVDLGITAVELLPIFQFDPFAAPPDRINRWGYQPVSFFAPHQQYATRPSGTGPADEFRDLVKALHRAGLEVILDVVYNHTAEGPAEGPTFGFRGLADDDYYMHEPDGSYADHSGTGNTLNANRPVVRRLILDSLRYWVEEMHVDGFRFDLAAVLYRDTNGARLADPPTLWDIETDPILAGTKLIAEAWDAGGLYEVGTFVGDRWMEWNGVFRDDVRAFIKGDPGKAAAVGMRFLGSPDIYVPRHHEPQVCINFVTCHDGFTLEDLVSYDSKHNEANGEANRDGADHNLSWNCGAEGPTTDPAIDVLRRRQIKNFLTVNLLAIGAPMLLMGDEVRRTQGGNNNGYCLEGPDGWFDWTALDRHREIHRFTRALMRARHRLVARLDEPIEAGFGEAMRRGSIAWSGTDAGAPDLGEASRSIAITSHADAGSLHVILSAYWEALDFRLPDVPAGSVGWRRVIDTTLAAPDDIAEDPGAGPIVGGPYRVGPRSVVVLVADRLGDA